MYPDETTGNNISREGHQAGDLTGEIIIHSFNLKTFYALIQRKATAETRVLPTAYIDNIARKAGYKHD